MVTGAATVSQSHKRLWEGYSFVSLATVLLHSATLSEPQPYPNLCFVNEQMEEKRKGKERILVWIHENDRQNDKRMRMKIPGERL